jgi:hypothetical protein
MQSGTGLDCAANHSLTLRAPLLSRRVGALGLGFVLSLAAAVPIFFVCRLMECAQHNTSSTSSVLRMLRRS